MFAPPLLWGAGGPGPPGPPAVSEHRKRRRVAEGGVESPTGLFLAVRRPASDAGEVWRVAGFIVVDAVHAASAEELWAMEASAIRWLIQHVPAEFWLQFKELLDIINLTHREHMVVINKRLGFSTKKSFGKHLSYIGAVRVPTEVEVGSLPSSTLAWTDRNGQYYVDVMNQTYADVFQAEWPGVCYDVRHGR